MYFVSEKSCSPTVGATKYGYGALNMRNVFRKIPRREGRCRGRRTVEKSCRASPSVHHCTVAPPTPSGRGAGASSTGKSKGAVNSQQPDSCETGGKFLPQRGNDTNASVRLHVIRYTSSKARKVI